MAFKAANVNIKLLDGKKIFYDRSGRLRSAGNVHGEDRVGIYIRNNVPKGTRKKSGVPLPPATLARRYRFLEERIVLRRDTLDAFVEAGLVREYDPVEALAGLKAALGSNPGPSRRSEALKWAFEVWRTSGAQLDDVLQGAGLYVPTLSGWHPADETMFSASWTQHGKVLENYLIAGSASSADCCRARDFLLVGQQDWPVPIHDAKRNWARFLDLLGVADGLRPTPARITQNVDGHVWQHFIQVGNAQEGFDADWCAEARNVRFVHPYTKYEVKGDAWRLPGQLEYDTLPEAAREALCILSFEHLKSNGTRFFQFKVGRFERYERDWDSRTLPTPLACFLRSKPWIATNGLEGLIFRRPGECWASGQRRGGPPRFIDRIADAVADLSEEGDLAKLAFSKTLGLRDWQSPATAVERLRDLGKAAVGLASNDRPTFRREYQRAWQDTVTSGVSLPSDLSVVVTRRSQYELLCGDADNPPTVVVVEDGQRFDARILSSAGQAILEAGQESTDSVATCLDNTGVFLPRRLNAAGVQLLVDGNPFIPRPSDPFLTSFRLEWLPEIAVIGHELRAEQLERGIYSATVNRRIRAIRVRRCTDISLVMDGELMSPKDQLRWYAYEHDELPTLILNDQLAFCWATLADTLSGGIARLVDARLRSLEPVLLRLALSNTSSELEAPSDEALARVFDCDLQTIRDHRAALRTSSEHIQYLLIPLVAYFGGIDVSRRLKADIEREGIKFELRKWLGVNLTGQTLSPDELIDACEQAESQAALRKNLALDYARFNRVLVELDEEPLSNATELQQMYEAYLNSMRPRIVDRLRRRYVLNFRAARDLTDYTARKNLDFLPFDQAWSQSYESLDMDLVQAHVDELLNQILGADLAENLEPLKRVLEVNRKTVRAFATEATPIVRAWCRQNNITLPEPWRQGEAQAIVRQLENKGLLDFEVLGPDSIPTFCLRGDCWPQGMTPTVDELVLGLNKAEIGEEETRHEQERVRLEIERRSIHFAGCSFDTGDPNFASNFQEVADIWLRKDESWYKRSRQQLKLAEFSGGAPPSGGGTGSDGRKGGVRRRERHLSDSQRTAMGVASEWLAFQYLMRRYPAFVDETCWVSENRARFFGGEKGSDTAGFDFLIRTPTHDWMYEVKSSMDDSGEFELTANEMRVAGSASKDGRRRYRILYVPYVFSPERWRVWELPNPMGDTTRNRFKTIGRGSVRLRFELR